MSAEVSDIVSPDEAAALAQLDGALRGDSAWSCQQFAALLSVDKSAVDQSGGTRYRLLGAYQGGALIAFMVCSTGPFDLEIEMLGVDVRYRRRGIAGALVRTVIEWGRRSGYERLLLEVREGNDAALSLYARLGFSLDARRSGYYPRSPEAGPGEREDALLMSLALARPRAP